MSNKIKIYKFYADWCKPCNVLNKELEGCELDIISVNVDDADNLELVKKYKILKMPFIIFADENGEVIKRLSKGSDDRLTREKIEEEYKKLI